jgi:predicted CoA-binding protein
VEDVSEMTQRILEEFSTIAVVGLSSSSTKAAHSVPAAMQAYGWRVIPVNPHADELLGEPVYRRLADIPEPVDVVNVFRPAREAADVARQAVEIGAKALWLQLGIVSADARRIATDAGLWYVEDRCVAVERARHAVRKAA